LVGHEIFQECEVERNKNSDDAEKCVEDLPDNHDSRNLKFWLHVLIHKYQNLLAIYK